jgi:hypothetical protein
MLRWRKEAILDLYTMVAAAFLVLSPWLFRFTLERAELDAWLIGAAIALMSAAAMVAFADWEEWINLALGCWLIVSPWVLRLQNPKAIHVCVAVGLVVSYLALLELWLVHYGERSEYSRRP